MSPQPYRVPSKDYAAQYRALLPELAGELTRVLLEENPILGRSVEEFEREFAAFLGTRQAVGVNSGTDALVLALRCLDLPAGGEVITAGNTFIATVSAIVMAGGKPVLVDPDPETMNLRADAIAAAVTPRTAAVIAVHLYGALSPIEEIREVCDAKGIPLLEDAAQAHGAVGSDGRRAGAFGRMGCFSFHPSKNLGGFGDGGIVTTSVEGAAERLRVLRNLGKRTKIDVDVVAPNTKLDTLQAAILRVKLRHLEAWNRRRRALAARYRAALDGVGDLVLPHDPGGERHVYHLFVVRSDRRDALRRHLREHGVNAGVHYPIPPHLQPLDVDLGIRAGELPVTEACARTVLSLPVSPELEDRQVEYVCDEIRRYFRD